MLARKRVVVGPVPDVEWPLEKCVERNGAGRGCGIGIVPPAPLSPRWQIFPDSEGVTRSVGNITHPCWTVCVLLIGTKNPVSSIQPVRASGILSAG